MPMDLSQEEKFKRLEELTETEYTIVELLCDEFEFNEVAAKLFIKRGSLKNVMTEIYGKLGITDDMARTNKLKFLKRIYCPVLKEYSEKLTGESFGENPEINDDAKTFKPRPEDIFSGEPKPPTRGLRGALLLLLIGVIIGGLVMYIILPNFVEVLSEGSFQNGEQGEMDRQETPSQGESQSPMNTPESPEFTPTERITGGENVPATSSSTATVTPEVPLANPPGYTFFDDFEDGPDPAWNVIYGQLGMSNGMYTIITPFNQKHTDHLGIIGDQLWNDVLITIKLAPFTGEYGALDNPGFNATGVIVLGYSEEEKAIGLMYYPESKGVEIGTYDGFWEPYPGTLASGYDFGFDLGDEENEIQVECRNKNVFVYVNGRKVTSATMPDYSSGYVGLWFQSNSGRDNVTNYSARIEEITVESIASE